MSKNFVLLLSFCLILLPQVACAEVTTGIAEDEQILNIRCNDQSCSCDDIDVKSCLAEPILDIEEKGLKAEFVTDSKSIQWCDTEKRYTIRGVCQAFPFCADIKNYIAESDSENLKNCFVSDKPVITPTFEGLADDFSQDKVEWDSDNNRYNIDVTCKGNPSCNVLKNYYKDKGMDCMEPSCSEILPQVKVSFDIDEENGATFEKYINKDNTDEVGYRKCGEDCEIVLAGKCTCNATTPTPTPTPQPTCAYYKGTLESTNNDKLKGKNNWAVTDKTGLSCVQKTLNSIYDNCNQTRGVTGNYQDDCYAIGLTNKFFGSLTSSDYDWKVSNRYKKDNGNVSSRYGVCNYADLNSHTWYTKGDTTDNNVCLDGYFYFDKDCKNVSAKEVKNKCGTLDASFEWTFEWSTPLSLIWEDGFDLNSNVTLVKFPLSLNNAEQVWYAWKASDKAPLLVYDPTQSGKISDASQLFGNWTFGGKRLASSKLNNNIKSGKWDNGFEALGSLDRNFDNKLQKDELNELALWFDANQDGVAQAGEVKSLKEAGVTTLFFNGYKQDNYGDLRLDIGYERTVDGKVIKGASIDWQEVGAPSKLALSEYYQKQSIGQDVQQVQDEILKVDTSKFSGMWRWTLDDSSDGGNFLFSSRDGKVKGFTFGEKRFATSPQDSLHSVVTMNRVTGEENIENGNSVLNFRIQIGNSFTYNQATLSKDGKSMTGKTQVVVAGEKGISYTWKAIKQK